MSSAVPPTGVSISVIATLSIKVPVSAITAYRSELLVASVVSSHILQSNKEISVIDSADPISVVEIHSVPSIVLL